MNYNKFSHNACKELMQIQDSFKEKYKIDSYSNWNYTQSTELLHLYNENNNEEIYFKYIPIGTFSTKTETWMWSWKNEYSIEQSIEKTLKIRELGEKYNFEKLSSGHFKSDEYDGWDFIAIALKHLGGLGGYRVQTDHLLKYMLIYKVVPTAEAKAVESKLIECEGHGPSRRAFICQHLNMETKTGFEEAFPSYRGMPLSEDDDFQAWCDECEKVRLKHNGWNDESMKIANIKLVCEVCYFNIKEFNIG